MSDLFTVVDGPVPTAELDSKTVAAIGKGLASLAPGKALEISQDKFTALGVSAHDLGENLRGAGYAARVQVRKDGAVRVLKAKPKPVKAAKPTVPAPGLPAK